MDEALLREIVAVARERDAWLLCDEVYRMLEHDPGTTAAVDRRPLREGASAPAA